MVRETRLFKGGGKFVIDKFKIVKEYVKPTDVTTRYLGQPKKRSGSNYFYSSPFKEEKTPSCCVNNEKGITDFSIGFHGDIVSFVSKLYSLTPLKACELIITDFNLPVNTNNTIDKKELEKIIQQRNKVKHEAEIINTWFNSTYIMLCNKLQEWQTIIRIFNRRGFKYAEALKIAYIQEISLDIITDEFINASTYDDKKNLYKNRKELEYYV